MSEMRECAEFACPGFWPKAGTEACGLRRGAECVHWRVEAQAAAAAGLGIGRGLRKLAEKWIGQRSFPEDEAEHQDQLLEAWLAGAETVAGLLKHVPSVTEEQMRAHVWRGEDEQR